MFSVLPVLAMVNAAFFGPPPTSRGVPIRSAPAEQTPARASADSLLLTPAQLRDRLTRGNVVVLHVGERADYNALEGLTLPYGGAARQVMIDMHPEALQTYGLSASDVARALSAQI